MRTNIEIDDRLMTEAMKVSGARTKRDTVDTALREMVRLGAQRRALLDLRGIGWDGDLEAMRTDKLLPPLD